MTFTEHAEHGKWEYSKPCVYCACGVRLYQGSLPTDQVGFARELDRLMSIAVRRATE